LRSANTSSRRERQNIFPDLDAVFCHEVVPVGSSLVARTRRLCGPRKNCAVNRRYGVAEAPIEGYDRLHEPPIMRAATRLALGLARRRLLLRTADGPTGLAFG